MLNLDAMSVLVIEDDRDTRANLRISCRGICLEQSEARRMHNGCVVCAFSLSIM